MALHRGANGEYRVLILGGDADGNLGDRAILQSMCLELRTKKMSLPQGQVLRIEHPSLYKGVASQLSVLLGLRERVLDVEAFVEHRRVEALVHLLEAAMRDGAGLLERVSELSAQLRRFNAGLLEGAP